MRVHVDGKLCQGHGLCQMTAPQIFELGEEDGQSYVLSEYVEGADADAARDGADACPERAITVE